MRHQPILFGNGPEKISIRFNRIERRKAQACDFGRET
jgi:hypothetical protein